MVEIDHRKRHEGKELMPTESLSDAAIRKLDTDMPSGAEPIPDC
jgi:hypothetical protein